MEEGEEGKINELRGWFQWQIAVERVGKEGNSATGRRQIT